MNEEDYTPSPTVPHKFLLFAGVIMPAISITVEATTHICAETFFDPIPTIWHLLLVVYVPLAQLQVWFAIRRGAPDRLRLAGFANAVAIGISIFYSIVYLPLVPLAALTLLIGLGILPLAPFLSLLAAILMRVHLKRVAANAPQKSFAIKTAGLLAALSFTVVALSLAELPALLTRIGLQMATSSSAQTRTEGIRFLRSYGSNDSLLRSCYNQTGSATDLIGYILSIRNPVTPVEAQKIYYRVTGETFDLSIPPDRVGGRLIPLDVFDFDTNLGGEQVGSKLSGLSLTSSSLDASADADGGVGYMQWTLLFKNDFQEPREARAEVQLPPGAVVSRLTLWVNGEEREAAFAGRSKVREAYQKVAVIQRRDPVLVTTAGRDRILVQCFPVPSQGEMKIRIGITVPLLLEDLTHARLLLPHFVNKNFHIPETLNHIIWVDSKTPTVMWGKVLTSSQSPLNGLGWRGAIPDYALSYPDSSFRLDRSNATEMWSQDPFETGGFVVRQSVEERVPAHLRRIVVVLDTSEAMRRWASDIEAAIKSLPAGFDVQLILADADGLHDSNPLKNLYADGREEISTALASAKFAGGADNAPALIKAWDFAAAKPGNNAIVWIHEPQLLPLQSVEELRQRWERPYGPLLYSVQTSSGSDEIDKKLDGIDEVKSVVLTGGLQRDLENLFARLTGRVKTLEFVRSKKKADKQLDVSEAYETSDHLARLWATDEVTRILSARDETLNDAATTLAVRYQLVTPVSGAVVLETAEQYRAAGLTPVDAGTVPTIPEPEMVALLIVAGVFLIWLFYTKYRNGGRGGCTV